MADVEIRIGRADEAEAVVAFWRLAAEGTDRHDSVEGFRSLVARDPDAVLVAEIDGDLVGTVIAGWDGWRAHLYRLAVHPDHRRRGVGTALIAAAERRFVRLGAMRADAMVLDDNTLAAPAWTAAGFHPQPQWSRWVKPLS